MVATGVRIRAILLTLAATICGAPAVHAGNIQDVDLFKNVSYTQTSDGNTSLLTVGQTGAFFSADLTSNVDNFYSSVTLTYGGSLSPISLSNNVFAANDYHYQTPGYPNQAAMDADFPFGEYTFTGDNGDTTQLDYTEDDYSESLPYLSGTSYDDLQGMNPGQSLTLGISPYDPTPDTTTPLIYFTIDDLTLNSVVFTTGALPYNTTSIFIPAGTLAYGDSFSFELDYSSRVDQPTSNTTFDGTLAFDTRTDGTFQTEQAPAPAPEPSSLVLSGLGLLGMGLLLRRK